MNATIALVLLAFASVGGFWGWRTGKRAMYRRSLHNDRPTTMSVEQYDRRGYSQGRRRWSETYLTSGPKLSKAALIAKLDSFSLAGVWAYAEDVESDHPPIVASRFTT
jgi:hypothetical protein